MKLIPSLSPKLEPKEKIFMLRPEEVVREIHQSWLKMGGHPVTQHSSSKAGMYSRKATSATLRNSTFVDELISQA